MILNRYDEASADGWSARAGDCSADRDLALRVYTSRLIGQDPDLVMHGGGNTSVKVRRENIFGETEDILHIKGSGRDLASIDAQGLPGLRLEPLRRLRQLDALSDEDMVNAQRCSLIDSTSPNPSVETLLHAYLPHKYVDHTHATPFLILANLRNAVDICREIFGDRMGIVPYLHSGFALGRSAAEAFEQNSKAQGLLLLNHGHVTFGDSARESYDRVIDHANAVAAYFGMETPTSLGERLPAADLSVLSMLRGAIAELQDDIDAPMPIFDLRNNAQARAIWDRDDVIRLSELGVATPDHVLHLKGWPLVLPKSIWSRGRDAIRERVRDFRIAYQDYFERNAARTGETKTQLAPEPRHAWIEEIGIVGIGPDAGAAKIAADLAEQNMRVRIAAENNGGFAPIGESQQFAGEYWSLEQAKLGNRKMPALQGKVAMVTGGAGAIGLATAKALSDQGASCILVDLSEAGLKDALAELGSGHSMLVCDVTQPDAGSEAMAHAVQAFGGIDILVSNAGSATSGTLLEMQDVDFRRAFELNFFAHKNFAIAAASLMKRQGRSGQILFNISKQAINPGPKLGAYGIPKAATLFLMRQLTLELGGAGIRVNGINADRIRSGLLTDDFIKERAASRGVSEQEYMGGNLLNREVEASHVASAFVSLALSERTTGHVMTVDGGNTAAELR